MNKQEEEVQDDSDDLQATIREAMAEVGGDDATADTSSVETKARDESGKFKAKESDEVAAAAKLQPEGGAEHKPEDRAAGETQEKLLTKDEAPRGWTPEAREKWNVIPPELRQEILRREEASAVGVRQLQERYAPMENFVQSIAPFIREASSLGLAPDQYIGNVMHSERVLRTADVPAKFQEILRIADQYGVPLRDVINQSVGQQVLQPPQQPPQSALPPEVMQELQEMRRWREEQAGSGMQREIVTFSKDKEFFGDVREHMANLLDAGVAKDLQDAYDQACWANPSIRNVMLSRQGVKNAQDAAAGASIKPAGTVAIPDDDSDEDDLEATVRKAYSSSATGRV